MLKHVSPSRRNRSDIDLMIKGATTVRFGHRIKVIRPQSTADALSSDWRAIGQDMQLALNVVRREIEPA